MGNRLLSVAELAKRINMSESWVYKKITAGEIPHIKMKRKVLFDPKDIKKWLEEQKVVPKDGE